MGSRPQVGSTKKTFEMSFVSNQNFEQAELEKYEYASKKANQPLKTKSELDKKARARPLCSRAPPSPTPAAPSRAQVLELLDCKHWQYTDVEISQMVKMKARRPRPAAP